MACMATVVFPELSGPKICVGVSANKMEGRVGCAVFLGGKARVHVGQGCT